MSTELKDIIRTLKVNSLRVTQSRKMVAKVFLARPNDFFKSDEIFKVIQEGKSLGCDQASVYRILNKFYELKILTKSQFNGEASRYKLVKNLGNSIKHEHYFKCLNCEVIEPFSDCLLSQKEKELEAKGYGSLSHHLEVTGLCPPCAGNT